MSIQLRLFSISTITRSTLYALVGTQEDTCLQPDLMIAQSVSTRKRGAHQAPCWIANLGFISDGMFLLERRFHFVGNVEALKFTLVLFSSCSHRLSHISPPFPPPPETGWDSTSCFCQKRQLSSLHINGHHAGCSRIPSFFLTTSRTSE